MATSKKSASTVSFEDFTETTLSAVSRTLIENAGNAHPLFKYPHITMGIIWRPDFPENVEFRKPN